MSILKIILRKSVAEKLEILSLALISASFAIFLFGIL